MGRGLQSDFSLSQWHSKCALETITLEVDRNANSRPLLRPTESEGLSNLCLRKSPGDSGTHCLMLGNTSPHLSNIDFFHLQVLPKPESNLTQF